MRRQYDRRRRKALILIASRTTVPPLQLNQYRPRRRRSYRRRRTGPHCRRLMIDLHFPILHDRQIVVTSSFRHGYSSLVTKEQNQLVCMN